MLTAPCLALLLGLLAQVEPPQAAAPAAEATAPGDAPAPPEGAPPSDAASPAPEASSNLLPADEVQRGVFLRSPVAGQRVRVRLLTEAPRAELYDVVAKASLCRAPCGITLTTNETRSYQVRGSGFPPSDEFSLLGASREVSVHFRPRIAALRWVGLGLTVVGGAGVLGGVVALVLGLVVQLTASVLSSTPSYSSSNALLLGGGIAAGGGLLFLVPGLILMLGRGLGREALRVEPRSTSEGGSLTGGVSSPPDDASADALFAAQQRLLEESARLEEASPSTAPAAWLIVGSGALSFLSVLLLAIMPSLASGPYAPTGSQVAGGILSAVGSLGLGALASVLLGTALRERAPLDARQKEIDAELKQLEGEGDRAP